VLTGLWNRRALEEAIEEDCARARRSRQRLSLVYIDLDNFKEINDRAGHEAGDLVLRQLAARIGNAVRARVDRGFRIGGDEFARLLPDSSPEQPEAVVERIRKYCTRMDPMWVSGSLGMSAGIIELEASEAPSDFVRGADKAMYLRKHSSGRRVIAA